MIAALLIALGSFRSSGRAQEPPALPALLSSAARYVDDYAKQMAGLVVEETYTQDVKFAPVMRPGTPKAPPAGPDHRTLKSDLLLIRPEGADSWRQFRDVFEVDARPVRDRNDRLARLFLKPAASAEAQADQIAAESARYNIGDIQRNINLPLLTLLVLDRGNQARFKFGLEKSSTDVRNLPRTPAFTPPPGTQAVRYEETAPHTLIRGNADRDLPIFGRMWIEPATGRVRMTELRISDRIIDARIHVAYRFDDTLGVVVPAEMHELYERAADRMRIEGSATYANVRRFQVQTDENIAPVKERQ